MKGSTPELCKEEKTMCLKAFFHRGAENTRGPTRMDLTVNIHTVVLFEEI